MLLFICWTGGIINAQHTLQMRPHHALTCAVLPCLLNVAEAAALKRKGLDFRAALRCEGLCLICHECAVLAFSTG